MTRRASRSVVGALGVALLCDVVLAGCGGATAPRQRVTISPSATASPAVATLCGTGAQALRLPAPGGGSLQALALGSGADAVVFLHEASRVGLCGFWPYASWLVSTRHVLAVLVDRCGYGQSTCPEVPRGDTGIAAETQPAVDWAREQGAKSVTLVGASFGGGDALVAGAAIAGIAAIVDLSGDGNDADADDLTAARRLAAPVLFAVAPDDPYCSVTTVEQLYAAVPSRIKRLVIASDRPGVHGWDLLFDRGFVDAFASTVAGWVTGSYM